MTRSQHDGLQHAILMLAFGLFSFVADATTVEFDNRITEFSLRNHHSLQPQLATQTGLGYLSVKSELTRLGCPSGLIDSLHQDNQESPTSFVKRLTSQLKSCHKTGSENPKLTTLLADKQAYLITAGASLNAPMSYLGHTLLLFLDEDNFYFSPVISILAPLNDDSKLSQTLKGGFGRIQAQTTVLPLHSVLSAYAQQDARSLNLLKLPKSLFNHSDLVEFFETKAKQDLPYNFFRRNCSTYTYEALVTSCNCLPTRRFVSPKTIQKNVQKALNLAGVSIIEIIEPSLFERFHEAYSELNKQQRSHLIQAIQQPNSGRSDDSKLIDAQVLASRLRFETYRDPLPSYQTIINQHGQASFLKHEPPKASSAKRGQRDALYESSLSVILGNEYAGLNLAVINSNSFRERRQYPSQTTVTAGELRFSKDQNTAKLRELTLLNIEALKPVDFVAKKPSWSFELGADRRHEGALKPYVSYGLGMSGSVANLTFYTLASTTLASEASFELLSGMRFKTHNIAVEYENRHFRSNELTFFYRASENLGIEYSYRPDNRDNKQQLSVTFHY